MLYDGINPFSIRYEVFIAVKICTVVFCIMTPYSLEGRSNNSEEYIASTFYPEDQNMNPFSINNRITIEHCNGTITGLF
jgi:hypothetical protein